MMNTILLFTDGSADPESGVGFGVFLTIEDEKESFEELEKRIVIKKFDNTSSTRLELQTLLWALKQCIQYEKKILVYTDSKNSVSLHSRRERLEKNEYITAKNKIIANAELYKEFYSLCDQNMIELIHVKGHSKNLLKTTEEKYFTLVDRASRRALRKYKKKTPHQQ